MEYKKLGDIATYINGYAFKPEDRGTEGLPIIRIQDLTGNAYDLGFYDGKHPEKIEINNGDVLISWSASLGVYVWNRGKALLNQHIFKVAFNKVDVDKNYFVYAVRHKLNEMAAKAHGATMKHIIKKDFDAIQIPFPSLQEQAEISLILDKVAHVIEERREELSKLDTLIKARFVEMFGDNQEVHKLSDIAAITGGLTKNSRRDKLELRKPYLRVANVFFASIDTTEILDIGLTKEEYEKTLLRNGDLLFVEGNGSPDQIGRVAIWNGEIEDCVHQNHLIKARFDLKRMNPVFAMYYFISERGRNQIKKRAVSTSGLYTLSVSKIADFEIPNPPMELQQQFAAFVAAIDKSKATVQKALDETQLLFDSLMQKYFG